MLTYNSEWETLPWNHWNSPVERFLVLPSFVIGEFAFILLSIVTLIHALSHGHRHVAVWIAAFAAGTANDVIFMVLPMVDNFWQSQACIMLTPRMPLYIPCVYNIFMYTSTVACWRLGLPTLSSACLTGLMGEMIYSPYDITGAKFLWWTWHDTDASIKHRLLGVPIGSSVWVITFTASFQLLVTLSIKRSTSILGFFSGLLFTCLLSTPLMVLQMSFLQLVTFESQGMPTIRSLIMTLTIYSLVIVSQWSKRMPEKSSIMSNWLLTICLEWYFIFLSINMLGADPSNHLSTGIHQELGDCNVTAQDLSGHYRQVYLCADSHIQDFSLDCDTLCSQNMFGDCSTQTNLWYTVCGKEHTNYTLWSGVTIGLCTLGSMMYAYALGDTDSEDKDKQI